MKDTILEMVLKYKVYERKGYPQIIFFYLHSMINADFCTGAVLISFGAILGKTSPVQLIVMTLFEVTLFGINEYIILNILGVSDKG